MNRRLSLALACAALALLAPLAAEAQCTWQPSSTLGDDPANPIFTDPEPQFPVWILDMNIELSCSIWGCYSDQPGGIDATDYESGLRRMLNAFALLDAYPFDASATWTDKLRDWVNRVDPRGECDTGTTAYTASAECRIVVKRPFHAFYTVARRAAVLAHESRHCHGGGHLHGSDCPTGGCDDSWAQFGPHRFYVHFARQFADDYEAWPASARRIMIQRANTFLNGSFEEHPGFNLALDETTSYEVPFTWRIARADRTCRNTNILTPDLVGPASRYGLRTVAVSPDETDLGPLGVGAEIYNLACIFRDPVTGDDGFAFSGPNTGMIGTQTIAPPTSTSFLRGLFVHWETAPIPATPPPRLQMTGAYGTLFADGDFLGSTLVSNTATTVTSAWADAWAVAPALETIDALSLSVAAGGGFDLVALETSLPWPFTTYVGGTGGTGFPVVDSNDAECPPGSIATVVITVPTANGQYVGFFGLLCSPTADVLAGSLPTVADQTLVHSSFREPATGVNIGAGRAQGFAMVPIILALAPAAQDIQTLECPAGYGLASVATRADQYVEAVESIACRLPGSQTWSAAIDGPPHSSGAPYQAHSCGVGRAIDGLFVRSGWFLDGVSLRCGELW